MALPNQKYLDVNTYVTAEFTSGQDVVPIVLVDPDTGEPYIPSGGGGGTVTGAINGLSLDGTNVVLGGSALDRATTVSGGGQSLSFGTTGSLLSSFSAESENLTGISFKDTQAGGLFEGEVSIQGFGSLISGTNILSGASSTVFASGALGQSRITALNALSDEVAWKADATNGLLVFNDIDNKGARYENALSYSSIVWATDDDYIPSIGLIKANVGGGGGLSASANGLSDDGTTVKLGGLINEFTVFNGDPSANIIWGAPTPINSWLISTQAWQYQAPIGGGLVQFGSSGITIQTDGQLTLNSTAGGVFIDGLGHSVQSSNGEGISYVAPADYANIVWATDDDAIPSIGLIKANVSGGGVNPGTDNRIPIYDLAGTNIEDSNIEVTLGADGSGSDYIQSVLGVHFNSSSDPDSLTSQLYGHTNANFLNHFIKQSYNPDSGNGFTLNQTFVQTSNQVIYEQRHNEDVPGPLFYNRHNFSVNGDQYLSIYRDTLSSTDGRVEIFTDAKFSVLGEGTVRSLLVADGLNQRVQVGRHNLGNSDLSGNTAYFSIESFEAQAGWDSNIPHLHLIGTIDSGLATLENGHMWRETSDGKYYIREQGISKPLVNDTVITPERTSFKLFASGSLTAPVIFGQNGEDTNAWTAPFDCKIVEVSLNVSAKNFAGADIDIDMRSLNAGSVVAEGSGTTLDTFTIPAGAFTNNYGQAETFDTATVNEGNTIFFVATSGETDINGSNGFFFHVIVEKI